MKEPVQAQNNAHSELTQRQRQILSLLQAGKVNKEIASELGIGVGTVKQHVVALFKKLKVRNRAMAASAGIGRMQGMGDANSSMSVDGLLERRPCVVLSTALPEEAEASVVRRLHGTLAALAFDHDALFLARKGNAGDVIFGIQRVTEFDLLKALKTAHAAYMDLSSLDLVLAGQLSGGLTAGLAVASMKRFGGWSGEAIASSAIYFARELVQEAGIGRIAFGQPAQDLMLSFGIGNGKGFPSVLFFHELDTLRWTGERFAFSLIDRSSEIGTLQSALKEAKAGLARTVYIEGETGMGKSRLCREIANSALRDGGSASLFRCQPLGAGEVLNSVLEGGTACLTENIVEQLRSPPAQIPDVMIIDDFHLLAKDMQSLLFTSVQSMHAGRLVIFSGRRHENSNVPQSDIEIIRLGRLSVESIEQLARVVVRDRGARAQSGKIRSIAQLAAGVPLFAVELARQNDSSVIALPLLVIICGRLEGLSLDRKILRAVARSKGCSTFAEIASELGEDVESLRPAFDRAKASGVLFQDQADGDRVTFTHPILRQAINQISME